MTMAESQLSRLPRLASSPIKPKSSSSAASAATPALSETTSNAGLSKRKTPSSDSLFQPASKRAAAPSATVTRSSLSRPPSSSSSTSSAPLRASQRTAAGSLARKASTPSLTQPRESRLASKPAIGSAALGARRSPNLSASTSRAPVSGSRTAGSSSILARSASRVTSREPVGRQESPAGGELLATNGRLEGIEKQMATMNELLAMERSRIINLETAHTTLQTQLSVAKTSEAEAARHVSAVADDFAREKAQWARDLEDLEREKRERSRIERELRDMEDELRAKKGELRDREEQARVETAKLQRELRTVQEDLEAETSARRRERDEAHVVKKSFSDLSTQSLTLTTQVLFLQNQAKDLQTQVATLQAEKAQLSAESAAEVEASRQKVEEAEQKVREGETERRKLHNTIQELKGNIRVFARVRPAADADGKLASIAYPDLDGTKIVVSSATESATGFAREQTVPFAFDKVFQPSASQELIFEEISGLTQSVLDGYNCCIFAYGQTGAGKSHTMEGGTTPESQGMIPRAIIKIFETTERLKEQGWVYELEGQFLEIYNETINDLLGSSDFDQKKHEIKHEKIGKTVKTTVTDAIVVPLRSPHQVRGLLERAKGRRAVAATLMNERSSRSHSVFSLRVSGQNALTEESCEGVLNLVDLAGSERLTSSGAGENKDRLKETININKSLSALADVIGALGSASSGSGAHVPYRNSKLTYLLQTSLSGQSKTLMMLNLSPLAAHVPESLCSLRFAAKVNSTQIGTARKQSGGGGGR